MQLPWGKNEDQWPDLSDATIELTAVRNDETFSKQGAVISASGTQSFRVELSSNETEVTAGWWDYDVQATIANGDIVTLVIGRLRVIEDYS